MENIELWKPVVGYENLYEISSFGNVRRLYKNGTTKILKPRVNKYGYYQLFLSKDNVSKCVTVHKLVAEAFISNPQNKQTVNHIDHDRLNNNVNNLSWATVKEQHDIIFSQNISNSLKNSEKHKRKVLCVETGVVYNSIKEAMEAVGYVAIGECCRHKPKHKTAGGFHWQYA